MEIVTEDTLNSSVNLTVQAESTRREHSAKQSHERGLSPRGTESALKFSIVIPHI